MAARLSAKRLPRYSLDFKLKAVKLTRIPGMEVQAVAEALDIHPVMLSRWRQEARECLGRFDLPVSLVVTDRPSADSEDVHSQRSGHASDARRRLRME